MRKTALRNIMIICMAWLLITPVACYGAASPFIDVTVGEKTSIMVNDQRVDYVDVSCGHIMVPATVISDLLGAKVGGSASQVKISTNGKEIILTVKSNKAMVNGVAVNLDTAPVIANDRMMVPLNFVVEAVGANIRYKEDIILPSIGPKLSDQQKWALATSALMKEANHMFLDRIGGGNTDYENIQTLKLILRQQWGIYDKSDALRTIKWLKEEGHRTEIKKMAAFIAKADQKQYQEYLAKHDPKEVQFVKANYAKLDSKSLMAWDYCRLVAVAEWAYIADYFTEDEMWTAIMPAAQILQSTFSSWEDMGNDFLIGVNLLYSGLNDDKFKAAQKRLLSYPDSPWLLYKWNMPLNDYSPNAERWRYVPKDLNGQAMFCWENGVVYNGEWKDGKFNGFGALSYRNLTRFSGEFKDGEFGDKGIMTLSNGDKYIGAFKNSQPDGQGKYKWADGSYYDGDFKGGLRHGHGIMVYANGKTQKGKWNDDKYIHP